MNELNFNPNKNAKHKFDVLYKIWLGRWFLVQTFEEEDDRKIEQDIREMRLLLEDDGSEKEPRQ